MIDLDVYFVKFFHKIIGDEIKHSPSSVHKRCMKRIDRLQEECENICFKFSAMRCAYVYHYAPCLASTLHNHFGQLLESNTFLLRRTVLRQNFTVCSICTGLFVDFVAVTSVLEWMLRGYCPSQNWRRKRIDVDFVIVTIDSQWTSTNERIAEKLSEDLADSSVLNFNFRFLRADFTMPLTDDVKQALRQSDLITMVYFLSNVCDKERDIRLCMIQEIVLFIRGGGVLFFLDSPEHGVHNVLKKTLESCDEPLIEIYGPLAYSIQRMRMLCRSECIRLYSKHYGWRSCALESVNCVGAWYKGTSEYINSCPNAVTVNNM